MKEHLQFVLELQSKTIEGIQETKERLQNELLEYHKRTMTINRPKSAQIAISFSYYENSLKKCISYCDFLINERQQQNHKQTFNNLDSTIIETP
ncbi:MAG: hypothetical protein ACI4PF_02015, partial [Christensenellales bacterium]